MARCEYCPSTNIRRTQPGAVVDDYVCRDCKRTFSRVAPAAKRIAIFTGLTVLTGGLDFGVLGGIGAALFGGGDSDT